MDKMSRHARISLCIIAMIYYMGNVQSSQSDVNQHSIDHFQPSVKATCSGGTMTVRVDTMDPFEGIIHAGPNSTDPDCSVLGRGDLKTFLRIDLTRTEGQAGSCGVKYSKRNEERRLTVTVRAHPTIELLQDRLFVVSCGAAGSAGFQNLRNAPSVAQLIISQTDYEDYRATTVLEGSSYNLRAEVIGHDPKSGLLVRRCLAFDESDTALQLVDDNGCAAEKILTQFTYDHEKGTADATIYSMFRLPHSNHTYIQCDISICKGECPEPTCGGGEGGSSSSPLARQTEEDSITTSTAVFVAQPGSEAAANVHYCSNTFRVGVSDDWVIWLTVAFGILLGIMLIINIFLCSAMTCSCTKSEIVEKEPSVYDEYSLYDSQYGGYTNEKISGSESDYGSEGSRGGERGTREGGGGEPVDEFYDSKHSQRGGGGGSAAGGGASSTISRSQRR